VASSSNTDFSSALQAQQSRQRVSEVDLERDMASLADTQLRYEADAKLLSEAYARLRAAMRERG
jgi:flagellar basal body rod protein FlgB